MNAMGKWKPAKTAPEKMIILTRQLDSLPMVMSREGKLWFWEPEHICSSVIPTGWKPRK